MKMIFYMQYVNYGGKDSTSTIRQILYYIYCSQTGSTLYNNKSTKLTPRTRNEKLLHALCLLQIRRLGLVISVAKSYRTGTVESGNRKPGHIYFAWFI